MSSIATIQGFIKFYDHIPYIFFHKVSGILSFLIALMDQVSFFK